MRKRSEQQEPAGGYMGLVPDDGVITEVTNGINQLEDYQSTGPKEVAMNVKPGAQKAFQKFAEEMHGEFTDDVAILRGLFNSLSEAKDNDNKTVRQALPGAGDFTSSSATLRQQVYKTLGGGLERIEGHPQPKR